MINYKVICHYPEWLLVRMTDERVVGSYASQLEAVNARTRMLGPGPATECSICRQVHGDEIQHVCE